jgi:hypothetical protein
MYGVNVKITGRGSFCACGSKIVASSDTPSRSGIFTPQRISGIGGVGAPLPCARVRVPAVVIDSAAKKMNRSAILFPLMQLPPPEHRLFPSNGGF